MSRRTAVFFILYLLGLATLLAFDIHVLDWKVYWGLGWLSGSGYLPPLIQYAFLLSPLAVLGAAVAAIPTFRFRPIVELWPTGVLRPTIHRLLLLIYALLIFMVAQLLWVPKSAILVDVSLLKIYVLGLISFVCIRVFVVLGDELLHRLKEPPKHPPS